MKAGKMKVPTRFRKETRFDVAIPAVPFRGTAERELERLKRHLWEGMRLEPGGLEPTVPYWRAASEAATLAWMTPFPLLVFPTLFEEKIRAARLWLDRQKVIRERSMAFLDAAA